jgi:hypothetical protein
MYGEYAMRSLLGCQGERTLSLGCRRPGLGPLLAVTHCVSYSVGTVKRYIEIEEIKASGQREKTGKSVTRANLGSRGTNRRRTALLPSSCAGCSR